MSVRKCPHGVDVGPLDDYDVPADEPVYSTYCPLCSVRQVLGLPADASRRAVRRATRRKRRPWTFPDTPEIAPTECPRCRSANVNPLGIRAAARGCRSCGLIFGWLSEETENVMRRLGHRDFDVARPKPGAPVADTGAPSKPPSERRQG